MISKDQIKSLAIFVLGSILGIVVFWFDMQKRLLFPFAVDLNIFFDLFFNKFLYFSVICFTFWILIYVLFGYIFIKKNSHVLKYIHFFLSMLIFGVILTPIFLFTINSYKTIKILAEFIAFSMFSSLIISSFVIGFFGLIFFGRLYYLHLNQNINR